VVAVGGGRYSGFIGLLRIILSRAALTLLTTLQLQSFVTQLVFHPPKVAVHCHAGLGRTGVLMSCYLVYYLRVRSNDALRYVRLKRPNSVQTRRQIDCVKEFEAFFLPQCLIFSASRTSDKKSAPFTIEQHLKRQKMVLHGFEARALKHIPKIVYR
jgi:protein tyrosine phosphatase domain-containing protein 1